MTGRADRRATALDVALVFLAVSAVFVLRLDLSPLNGTEALRAVPALAMLESGDWLVPRLWGAPYLAKPPMFLWMLATSSWVFGTEAEWVFRLPSALCAGATAGVVCLFANRWFGRPAGLIGGLSLLALPGLWSQSIKADIDAANTLATTIAALALLRSRLSIAAIAGTGLAIGAALLLKGPAALPVVAGAIVGRAVAERSWRTLLDWRPPLAVLVGAAMLGAWMLAVQISLRGDPSGAEWRGMSEIASRMTAGGSRVLLGTLAMPLAVIAAAAPLSLLSHLAGQRATSDPLPEGSRRAMIAALATIAAALLVFAAARTSNSRYALIVLPLFCVVAGGVGKVWLDGRYDRIKDHALRAVLCVSGIAGLGAIIALTAGQPPGAASTITIALGACAALGLIASILRARRALAMALLAIICALVIGPYASLKSRNRWREEPITASAVLRDAAGQEPILTDVWMVTAPALFYYADAAPVWRSGALASPHALPSGRWVLFGEAEWEEWSSSGDVAFDRVISLTIDRRTPVLARVAISPAQESAAPRASAADR